jgi:hypothetical protein
LPSPSPPPLPPQQPSSLAPPPLPPQLPSPPLFTATFTAAVTAALEEDDRARVARDDGHPCRHCRFVPSLLKKTL